MRKRRWLAALLAVSLCVPQWGVPAAAEEEEALPKQYIIKLSDDAPQLFSAGDEPEGYLGFGMYLVDGETAAALAQLGQVEFVEEEQYCRFYAEPRYTYPTTDRFVRNKVQWNLEFMHIEEAWAAGLDGTGTTVAIIDSGFRVTHEDRPTALLSGKNLLANNPATPGYTDPSDITDEMGHGSFVAGVVAAATDNGLGVAGVAPGAAILPLKCGYRVGQKDFLPLSAVVQAINEAINAKVDVINMSLGLPDDSAAMRVVIDRAVQNNILLIAAVGNDYSSIKNYPATYSNVVGVGAVDRSGRWAPYSNNNSSVWITAPGSAICGLGYKTDNEYIGTWDGTSLAAPAVAGLAAMARQADPGITVTEFFQLLKLTADHSPNADENGYSYKYGYGYADAAALTKALTPRVIHYANMDDAPAGAEDLMPADRSYNIYEKKAITLASPSGAPEGYVFGGWYEDPTCQGTAVTSTAPDRDGVDTADRTYYARWLSSNTDLKSVSLTADGVEYAGEYSPDAEAYTIFIPKGTQLSSAALSAEPAFPNSTCTAGEPGEQWEVTVTAEDGVTEQTHTVTIDASACAPVRKADASLSVAVAPASLDGKTEAISYEAPLSDFFEDGDTDPGDLIYTLANITIDGAPPEEGAAIDLPVLADGKLCYEPSAADAGAQLAFDLTASDGRFTSQPLHIELTVGEVPFSMPVLTPDSGIFSTQQDAAEHRDLEVELTLYGSALTGITGPGGELTSERDYVLSDEQHNMPDGEGLCLSATPKPQTVTLKKEYLSTLPTGEQTITFHFAGTQDSTADYTLTVKAKDSGGTWSPPPPSEDDDDDPDPPSSPTPKPTPTPEPSPTPTVTQTPEGDYEMTFFGEPEAISVEQLFSQAGDGEDYDLILRTDTVAVRIPGGLLTPESDLKRFLPAAGITKGTVVAYTDSAGKRSILPLSLVEDGKIVYVAQGEGHYEVIENPVTYDDYLPRWVSGAASFVSSRGLFQGVSASSNRFSPHANASRATIFTILARLDGQEDTYAHGRSWYEPGLAYCREKGLTDGAAPDADITREELVTLLWRYADSPEEGEPLAGYPDAGDVAPYARQAFAWAVENGLVIGTKDGRLAPGDCAARGEIAVILERFIRHLLPT